MSTGRFENQGINEGVETITELYSKIAVQAEELVHKSYEEAGKAVVFPIDIKSLRNI